MRGHAKIILNSLSKDELTWESLDKERKQDIVELWFPNLGELRFRLKGPGADESWSGELNYSSIEVTGSTNFGNDFKMSYTKYHQDNGDSRVLITINKGRARRIKHGTWTLDIVSSKLADTLKIDAWVERINARPINFEYKANDEITLSIPGTAHSVIAVAAIESTIPFTLHPNSSFGPTRDERRKPNLCAPGVKILGAKAGTSQEFIHMSGTSMAAPHVSGAVALLFSWVQKNSEENQLNANQLRALIENALLKSDYSSGWTNKMGYGALDMEMIFEELRTMI